MSSELQHLLSGALGQKNIWVPAAQKWIPSRPAAGWGQWPGSLCPSVAHRNCTPSLEVGGLHGGGSVCSIPLRREQSLILRWVTTVSETAWCPPHPARSAGHYLPTLSSGEEPVPHQQWLESLQHPLRMEHGLGLWGDTKWAQRSVQELGVEIMN